MKRDSFLYKGLKRVEKPEENRFFQKLNPVMNKCLAVYGRVVFGKLCHQFPGSTLLLMPSRSAGDMRFLSYAFPALIKTAGIRKYALIVDQTSCYKSALSCGFENVYPVGMLKQKALLMYQTTGKKDSRRIINCYPWCMFDFKSARLSGPEIKQQAAPAGERERLQKEYGIVPGRTVILSPYENSISEKGLPLLPESFWNLLSEKLTAKGFRLFTNCSGTESEPVIKGTDRIFPKFSEIRTAAELAGFSVAVRSGFVDYMAGAGAVKIILYPSEKYLRYWSLSRVAETGNDLEIVYCAYVDEPEKLADLIAERIVN